MAVPSSGSLSTLGLAQELLYCTYGSGSVNGPISMYDLLNGGNSGGSGETYPSIKTQCTPNPTTRTLTAFKVRPGSTTATPIDVYFNSGYTSLANLKIDDYLYKNSSGSQPYNNCQQSSNYCYILDSDNTLTTPCGSLWTRFLTDSNGRIKYIECEQPAM